MLSQFQPTTAPPAAPRAACARVFAVALHRVANHRQLARVHIAHAVVIIDNGFVAGVVNSALTVKTTPTGVFFLAADTLSLRMRPSLSVTVSSPPRKVVTSMVSAPTITMDDAKAPANNARAETAA